MYPKIFNSRQKLANFVELNFSEEQVNNESSVLKHRELQLSYQEALMEYKTKFFSLPKTVLIPVQEKDWE